MLVALRAVLSAVGAADAQTVRAGSGKIMAGPASNFIGKVTVLLLTYAAPPGQSGTALVTFAPGARTKWHTHPAGQTLYVTDGCG